MATPTDGALPRRREAAWIGDRAQGLHTYELIRDGYLTSLLSRSELALLNEDRQFNAFLRATTENVDADELFYLRTMRRIIQECAQPFFHRKLTLQQLEEDLCLGQKRGIFGAKIQRVILAENHEIRGSHGFFLLGLVQG